MGKIIESGLPCDLCASSDAVSVYQQEDGSTNSYCFSCEGFIKGDEEETKEAAKIHTNPKKDVKMQDYTHISSLFTKGIDDRRISKSTCEHYGVKSLYGADGQELERYYPVHKDNKLAGFKKRVLPKDFTKGVYGDVKGDIQLFGQHLFTPGKVVVISCGQEDALAAYEITKFKSKVGRGLPCVSFPNGMTSKDLKNNLDWVDGFEKIIFAVDQEEDKDLAKAKEFAKLFTLGKVHIARFSENDASDMCSAGKFSEFYESLWNAKQYTPAGIIRSEDTWDAWKNRGDYESIPFPPAWGLGKYGDLLRLGSLITIGAGTGMGKTTMFKELEHYVFSQTGYNVGIIHLEESLSDTVGGLMSIHGNKRLTLPNHGVTESEQKEIWNELFQEGRFMLDQAFGSLDGDGLASNIRFMTHSGGCKFIFVDHLSALTSLYSSDTKGSKLEKTEKLVVTLQMLTMELNICIILASHVRKRSDESTSYENGAIPDLDALYGSSSVKNYSNVVVTLQRNQREQNGPVTYHVKKNRLTGLLGPGVPLVFDFDTGRLKPQEVVPKIHTEESKEVM